MISLSKQAIETYEHRQAPTLRKMRYGNRDLIQGLTQTAQALKNHAAQAEMDSTNIGRAVIKAFSDPTVNEHARLARAGALVKGPLAANEKRLSVIEAAVGELEAMREYLARTAFAPPSGAGQAAIDGELRAMVKAAPVAERPGLARSSPEMLAAVSRAPAALSGLAAEVHRTIRREYAREVEPNQTAAIEDLESAIQGAMTATTSLEQDLGGLVDVGAANLLEKSISG